MAFDDTLAERIRERIADGPGFVEKKMFGGLAFLVNGNMCCGVMGSEMIIRIDPSAMERVLTDTHARLFDMSGRPMKGWIVIESEGLATDESLARWFQMGVEYAESLPEVQIDLEPSPDCVDSAMLAREVESALRNAFSLRIPVSAVAPGALPRFEHKARRWIRTDT